MPLQFICYKIYITIEIEVFNRKSLKQPNYLSSQYILVVVRLIIA